ncbi:MAG: hypothetical protein WBQ45_23530 [Roseiarcus sp.]|uniref:hypothetical protein n=1 Tax=Roseiarcus sp. TaxID=1969460 RepID=UPI003BAEF352
MTTLTKLACAFVLAGGLAVPAFAATTGTPSPGSAGDPNVANGQSAMSNDQNDRTNGPTAGQNATTGQNAMHIGQRLRADLGKAGYTDITIMPSSFIVHAKDSQGNPVMMVVSPDSVTAITEENARANSASNSNHTGANNGASTSTTGAAPQPAPTKP